MIAIVECCSSKYDQRYITRVESRNDVGKLVSDFSSSYVY